MVKRSTSAPSPLSPIAWLPDGFVWWRSLTCALLVAFALRGFNQGWNVEVERRDPSAGAGSGPGIRAGDDAYPDAPPFPA